MNVTARIDRADDREEHRDPEQQRADRPVEERLDGQVAAEDHRDRHDRRQDPQPDDDGQQHDEQADAERRPRLAVGPAAGLRGRLGLGRVVQVGPRVVQDAGPDRLEPGPALGDDPGELDVPCPQRGELRLLGPELGDMRRGRSGRGPSRRAAPRPPRPGRAGSPAIASASLRTPSRSASISSIRRSSTAGARDGGGTLARPAKPSGSAHDWRTEPVRVYFGPAGARSPANRSPVSRPHSPRYPSSHVSASETRIGVHSWSQAGTDGRSVAAGVVHERDAQRPPDLAGEVAGVRLVERVAPDPAQQVQRPAQVPLARERQPHDVLAALEVRRVRAGARVDDRVAVHGLEARVVPSPAEVVALLVVGRGAEPGGLRRAVGHAPRGRRSTARGRPRGRWRRRTTTASRSSRRRTCSAGRPSRRSGRRGRGRRRADRPRGSPRSATWAAAFVPPGTWPRSSSEVTSAGVDEPGRQADAREAAPGVEARPLGPAPPAAELDGVHRLGDEPQELEVAGRRVADRAQRLERQGAGRGDDRRLADRRALEQVARLDVPLHRHRQEELALR